MRSRTLLIASAVAFCAIAIPEYWMLTGPLTPAYKTIGECIARNASPDEVVFAQFQQPWAIPLPQVVLYAHRNIAIWQDEPTARQLAQKNGVSSGVLFVIDSAQSEVTEIRRMKSELRLSTGELRGVSGGFLDRKRCCRREHRSCDLLERGE